MVSKTTLNSRRMRNVTSPESAAIKLVIVVLFLYYGESENPTGTVHINY